MNNLELVKVRENIVKNYENESPVEVINSVEYQVKNSDAVVGTANICEGSLNFNIYGLHGVTIQALQAKLEASFG